MDGALPNVALPTIAADLNISASDSVLLVSVYQLVLVMTLLPLAALGSRIGLRKMYQLGLCLFLVSAVLCFLAPSFPLLLAARCLQAFGAATALSVASALVRSIYPTNQLGRGIGINTIIVASSGGFAPILGGYIVAELDWHWIFIATTPLGLLSLAVGQRALPFVAGTGQAISKLGSILCALTFGLIISGLLILAGDYPASAGLPVLVAGAVSAVFFVRHELQQETPILPVDLLADRVVALSIAAAQFAFVGSMMFLLSLPFRLQEQLGFSPSEIGITVAPFPLALMFVAPIAGALSDRFQPAILGFVGMGGCYCRSCVACRTTPWGHAIGYSLAACTGRYWLRTVLPTECKVDYLRGTNGTCRLCRWPDGNQSACRPGAGYRTAGGLACSGPRH